MAVGLWHPAPYSLKKSVVTTIFDKSMFDREKFDFEFDVVNGKVIFDKYSNVH